MLIRYFHLMKISENSGESQYYIYLNKREIGYLEGEPGGITNSYTLFNFMHSID